MTLFTEGRLQVYERMMRDNGNYHRGRSDGKPHRRDFNNLDVLGTEGSKKQFIILVEKGREGWNCRSLLGIALFRSPKSKIFVLQATMRCLRKLTDEQLKATVFLSKENLDTLDEELRNNYNMEIKDFGQAPAKKKSSYKVRVLPPPRSIKMKRIWHEYSLIPQSVKLILGESP